MATTLNYSLTLVSDAEPSSGFGTELVNSLVPMDIDGKMVIPASHIKGLMKQAMMDVSNTILLDGLAELLPAIFGKEFDGQSLFSLTDCKINGDPIVKKMITRTSLNEHGTAKDTSLRTTEAVPADTVFEGHIHFSGEPSHLADLVTRYLLISVMEVGGSRNRGCGACYVAIDDDKRTPGELLDELVRELKGGGIASVAVKPVAAEGDPTKKVTLKIAFTADGPLCVPELPNIGNNAICSGFTIPASAVQGMILHRINALNPYVATACFNSENFRTWPLQATIDTATGLSVRASSSHKISKLPVEKQGHLFCDETIEPYDWKNVPKNAPLKSADGVLIPQGPDVHLWRSGDMPRHLTAHGVINGDETERNLYTVEALAVKKFTGMVVLPEDAAVLLKQSLKNDPIVHIGKSRSVRGSGTLFVEEYSLPASSSDELARTFIVQSPLLIDGDYVGKSAEAILEGLVKKSGWGVVEKSSASTQVLFGWNRHKNGLQKAECVIAPGSVFRLNEKPKDLEQLLVKGIGAGKERGYGSVLPHPGIASDRHIPPSSKPPIKSRDQSGIIGWKLWNKAKDFGLMPSQIAQVLAILAENKDQAIEYLERQRTGRPAKYWDRWKPVIEDVKTEIRRDSKVALKALKVWHDLAVYAESKGGKN